MTDKHTLVEPVAIIVEAAIERHGCFSLRGTMDDAREIEALYANRITALEAEVEQLHQALAQIESKPEDGNG